MDRVGMKEDSEIKFKSGNMLFVFIHFTLMHRRGPISLDVDVHAWGLTLLPDIKEYPNPGV